jgi:hypothetical protein
MVSHSLSPAIWVRTAFCSEGNFMPAMEVNRPSNLRTCAASTVTLQSQAKSILPGHADLAPRCVSDRCLFHHLMPFTAGPHSKRSTERHSHLPLDTRQVVNPAACCRTAHLDRCLDDCVITPERKHRSRAHSLNMTIWTACSFDNSVILGQCLLLRLSLHQ